MKVTYVTSNLKKAEYAAKLLDIELEHVAIDLDEVQSLDLNEIVEHKVRQAYEKLQTPVIVEDVSLRFKALNDLPGPFIKWFIASLGMDGLCRLVDRQDRAATANCVIGYFDGVNLELFQGELQGKVATKPAGEDGFGWDPIFIPDGHEVTRAELSEEDYPPTYLKLKPFDQLKTFLDGKKATN